MLTLSTEHQAARDDAARLPALQATLARLTGDGTTHSTLTLYDHADPDDPAAVALAAIPLESVPGVIDEAALTLTLTTPVEAMVDGADASAGSVPLSARVTGPGGAWEFDATVSITGGAGEIQFDATDEGGAEVRLYNGATARVTAAVIQG